MSQELQSQTRRASPASSFTPVRGGVLQRKCACGGSAGLAVECEGCSKDRLSLQRATRNSELGTRNSASVPPIVFGVLRSPGQMLDQATRDLMEPRFGHDFSQVRVHTDASAIKSAQAVNALAYTVGRDVVFGQGQYASGNFEGQRLLAHELAHVIQQEQAGGLALQRQSPEGEGDSPAEQAAGDAAKQVVPAQTGTTADAGAASAQENQPARSTPGTTGSAKQGRYVVYQNEVRVGGSRAWRNNNPGNMRGPFATAHGAIGSDKDKFAVFPDQATGKTSLVALLKSSSYINLTIEGVMNKYAPSSENDTTKYIATIVATTGVTKDTVLNTLTDDQIAAIADVIEVVEGMIAGTIYTCADASAPAEFRTMLGCPDVPARPTK